MIPFLRRAGLSHTHGSYALLFNTLMHPDALARAPPEMVAEDEPMR
ncbi:MAG: hypothetical protein OXI83_18505 [Gemmatimonadota bacterium]|nr:hypothetical protein [Gemmatimonadota bacterium]